MCRIWCLWPVSPLVSTYGWKMPCWEILSWKKTCLWIEWGSEVLGKFNWGCGVSYLKGYQWSRRGGGGENETSEILLQYWKWANRGAAAIDWEKRTADLKSYIHRVHECQGRKQDALEMQRGPPTVNLTC